MILPDLVHPRYSLYYRGSVVLKVLQKKNRIKISDLYVECLKIEKMKYSMFVATMDWLFALGKIELVNNLEEVKLCM